jgi:hypothetical protein
MLRASRAAAVRALALPMPRLRRRRPDDRALAMFLIAISATGSLGGIALWLGGHGYLGLRLASGATLLILGLLLL